MKDEYMTVGDLRQAIEGLPDNAKVFYHRIEDVYFEEHGWTPDKLVRSDFTEPEENINDQYIRAFCAFSEDGDLLITAHY